MPSAWPRNIVPYTEDQLRALADVSTVAFYFATIDRPAPRASLAPDELPRADSLVKVGLLEERNGKLHATATHRRDPDGASPSVVARRRAVLGYAEAIVGDAKLALDARQEAAHAAVGVVHLPDRPAIIARATAIIAEAEDQLRALAEEEKDEEARRVRAVVFIGSKP